MKNINQIIDKKELEIGKHYVYISRELKSPLIVLHEKAKFQNEEHEKNYLESQGGCFMMLDLETNSVFDLHKVDYLDARYKIYPIEKENLGFILGLSEFAESRKSQNILIKHFRNIHKL